MGWGGVIPEAPCRTLNVASTVRFLLCVCLSDSRVPSLEEAWPFSWFHRGGERAFFLTVPNA